MLVYKMVDRDFYDFRKEIQYLPGKKVFAPRGFHYAKSIEEVVGWGHVVCKDDFAKGLERYVVIDINLKTQKKDLINGSNMATEGYVIRILEGNEYMNFRDKHI